MNLCLSISNPILEEVFESIKKYDLVEIRLDLCNYSKDEISTLCDAHDHLIFTFRDKPGVDDMQRREKLEHAIKSDAAYIDLDISNKSTFFKEIKTSIHKSKRTKLITSYHNYKNCPSNHFLFDILLKMAKYEPDLKKLVCTSWGNRDNERILAFNNSFKDTIAFNMGALGKSTRIECVTAGAPFTYVALEDEKTAPGQMNKREVESYLKRHFKS